MRAIRDTCHDLSGTALLERKDGRSITALDLQGEHLARVQATPAPSSTSVPSRPPSSTLWERGLEALRAQDPGAVATELDWAAKHQLLSRYAERAGTGLDDPRVTRLALAYHDVSPEEGCGRLEAAGMLRATSTTTSAGPR
ncbi:hypothetical protein ADENT20671_0010 [Actinomyces denticolens]|nr:hypothetical protein ADENT20671_0010 [Actinomyces denticolens]